MSDVNVLYAVTAVTVLALLAWAGYVLATAQNAPDESPVPGPDGSDAARSDADARREALDAPTKLTRRPAILDETPPPATVDVTAPSERAVAIAGKSAPVVMLPVMRSRLDSHSEISDGAGGQATAAAPGAGADEPAPESTLPSGPALSLVSAIGRSEPSEGPGEVCAIVDRQHLFILADGGGQRVQNELVSAVVVDSLAKAFEVGADASFPAHATLPRRADRLRRAVIAALTVLESRADEGGLDMARVGVLAAHFTPDNRSLYIATAGPDSAYRMRVHEVMHLNKASILSAGAGEPPKVDTIVLETAPEDVYVFGSDKAFQALGDELRAVLTFDPSIDRVAAHFVAAATREGKSAGMTAIVVKVNPPRP